MEREISALLREDNCVRRRGWLERTWERIWESSWRMAWRRCSAVEAGDPEDSAAEEKEVEEKEVI